MPRMKLRKLEEYLEGVEGFENPKIKLEQYQTPPHIASNVMFNIQDNFDDIEGKLVGDLGCGCGMLSIAAFLLGAQHIVAFEKDNDALEIFRENMTNMELPRAIDCVQTDILQLDTVHWNNVFDTVVANPPFGTKNNAGIDMQFVEAGIRLAANSMYSLHKTATRDYIQKKCREWNVKGKVVAELRYNIDSCYKFHKNSTMDIQVDMWKFDVSEKVL